MRTAADAASYGSDRAGLVYGYAFEPEREGRPVDSDSAAQWLARQPDRGFLWLHFSSANSASETWLRRHVELPAVFYESLREGASTRVEAIDDGLLAIVNDVQFFAHEASSVSSVTFYIAPRVAVSARTTALRSIDRLRGAVRAGAVFSSTAALLAHLLRDQADVMVEIVRGATRQVDEAEDRIISGRTVSRVTLGTMRRTLVRLQRLLTPEPAALFRLLSRPPSWLTDGDVGDLRQSAEELSTAVADSVALVERVRLLQEELTALLNEQTNRTLFILTVVTVLALPMTIIPGLFGMNVGGIPLTASPAGFWIVLVVMVLVVLVGAGLVLAAWQER
ncbi:MAG: transporter [Vicinamibacterales bacterium]